MLGSCYKSEQQRDMTNGCLASVTLASVGKSMRIVKQVCTEEEKEINQSQQSGLLTPFPILPWHK